MYLNKVGQDPTLVKAEDLLRFLQTTMVLRDSSGNASSPPTSPRADQISSPAAAAKPAAAEPQGKVEAPPRLSAPGFSTPAGKPAAPNAGTPASGAGGKAAAGTVVAVGGGAQVRIAT